MPNVNGSTVTTQQKSQQWPQFLAVCTATLLAVCSGFQTSWPSPSLPKLLTNDLGFEITEEESSLIVTITPLGFLIGSPITALLLDRIGRKHTLLALALPQILHWLLIAISFNITFLYIARFIGGIADGGLFTALPIYISEVAEPRIRGKLGVGHSLGVAFGGFLINAYGSYVSIRMAALISLSIPPLFIVTFVWMPESPYYLLTRERTDEARKWLRNLRRSDNVDVELLQLTSDVQRQLSEPGTIKDVFTIKTNLIAFIILLALRTFQQFAGITVLQYYTQTIFHQTASSLSATTSSLICMGLQTLNIGSCSLVIDRLGRKPLYIVSCLGATVVLIIMGLYLIFQDRDYDLSSFLWLPIITMVLYYAIGAIGLLTVTNLMSGELLSIRVKSKVLGLANMYLGVCITVTSMIFQLLGSEFGIYVPFFFFGICCMVGAIFFYWFVPETKGISLEEIQQKLKQKKFPCYKPEIY